MFIGNKLITAMAQYTCIITIYTKQNTLNLNVQTIDFMNAYSCTEEDIWHISNESRLCRNDAFTELTLTECSSYRNNYMEGSGSATIK